MAVWRWRTFGTSAEVNRGRGAGYHFLRLTLAALLSQSVASQPVSAESVTVAVAANFASALNTIAEQFSERTGHRVETVVGATGLLSTQIERGAPFDVFMAADTDRPSRLVAKGLADADSQLTYALGRLVFWVPGALDTVDVERFMNSTDHRFAMANPRLAPYGSAALDVITSLSHTGALSERAVLGQNVGGAFTLVRSGNLGAGFVALSQVLIAGVPTREFQVIASDRHGPIAQDAVLTLHGSDNPAAQAFIAYLGKEEVQLLIRAAGYDLPEGLLREAAAQNASGSVSREARR